MQIQKNKLLVVLLLLTAGMRCQNLGNSSSSGELQMTFPSIYFKHNSTEYAKMPYKVDSCFAYIAFHLKDINDFVIWRDSLETDMLTMQRIKKLKSGLSKYKLTRKIHISSMEGEQKISRHTIEVVKDPAQVQYLLSLNSVFDISKNRTVNKKKYTNHVMRPSIFCGGCWKSGFHWRTRMKLRKMERNKKIKGV